MYFVMFPTELRTLDSSIVYERDEASFVCASLSGSLSSVRWIVNGSSLEELGLGSVTQQEVISRVGGLIFLDTLPEYNGTTVQCVATFPDGTVLSSNIATLLVQGILMMHHRDSDKLQLSTVYFSLVGLLDAMSDLSVEFVSPTFIISWVAPFTLDAPGNPDITYCISITNTSTGSSLMNECGIIATTYSVDLAFDPCVLYNAAITPINQVGNGTSATRRFPGI